MDTIDTRNTHQHSSNSNFWFELIKLILLSLVIVIPFRLYIAQPFIVDGASMDPTFKNGEYLIVDEISYRLHKPERGSVLIFRYPRNPSKFFIKRIIGLPGETVEIANGIVTIKNNEGEMTLDEPYVQFTKSDNLKQTLGDDEYFVMGDNRLGSADSRIWGPVTSDKIIGRPIIRFLPFAFFPGNVVQE